MIQKKLKKILADYKFGFDVFALILFLMIMIPNFIWFAVPAPNDVLRLESKTKILDVIASTCQVVMIVTITVVINKNASKQRFSKWFIPCVISVAFYFIGWIFYYGNAVNSFVIIGLTLPPCMAFLFFEFARKNYISFVPTVLFTVCHLVYAAINFMI